MGICVLGVLRVAWQREVWAGTGAGQPHCSDGVHAAKSAEKSALHVENYPLPLRPSCCLHTRTHTHTLSQCRNLDPEYYLYENCYCLEVCVGGGRGVCVCACVCATAERQDGFIEGPRRL
mgnify:CR=1 FL=1